MAICEQCSKEHDGSFGSGRFCCRSCSNKWVALHQSDEAKARKVEKGKGNLRRIGGFTQEARSKGAQRSNEVRREKRKIWLDEVLSGSRVPDHTSHMTDWLISFGYKESKCESCNLSLWLGKDIPLELHHVDGNRSNWKLSNLQILCPNCHAMTDNYSWKGARLKSVIDKEKFK